MVPKIRGIAKAKRTWVREPSGSREDSVPQEASAEKQFRRLEKPAEQNFVAEEEGFPRPPSADAQPLPRKLGRAKR